jgi:rubrerythrin
MSARHWPGEEHRVTLSKSATRKRNKRARDAQKNPALCEGCGVRKRKPPSRYCPGCQDYLESV